MKYENNVLYMYRYADNEQQGYRLVGEDKTIDKEYCEDAEWIVLADKKNDRRNYVQRLKTTYKFKAVANGRLVDTELISKGGGEYEVAATVEGINYGTFRFKTHRVYYKYNKSIGTKIPRNKDLVILEPININELERACIRSHNRFFFVGMSFSKK